MCGGRFPATERHGVPLALLRLLALAPTAPATTILSHTSVAIGDRFPSVNGEVFAIAAISDTNGGGTIYTGGAFTEAGGTPRNNAAAFDPTLALLPWNPGADGAVETLLSSGGRLFAGGEFQNVAGSGRKHAVAFVAATGALASPCGHPLPALPSSASKENSPESAFLFEARDRFYDFPIPFIAYSIPIDPVLYAFRLAPGEKPPRR